MSNMQDFYCEEISGFFNFPHSLSDNEREWNLSMMEDIISY